MKKIITLIAFACLLSFLQNQNFAEDWQKIEQDFKNPPQALKSRPLWFWNKVPTREETVTQMKACVESGYAGLAILPAFRDGNMKFMSPEFLEQYKIAADTAKELGIKLCLYDEFWFPSGSADDLIKTRFPEHLCKRLDMVATDADAEANDVTLEIPEGTLMGCVAMNTETWQRTNITANAKDGTLHWQRPANDTAPYKIMAFVCVLDGQRNLVDYLEPESVKKFIELTYAGYQKAMPEHFGTTIDSAFYDEPMLYTPGDGRPWTPRYNEYFAARLGYDPVPLYPAMFMEIGPETASARNALFGFRATLFSEGFVKTITDWLKPYNIPLTGHLDQEEVVNPTGVTGDAIKFFKYQDIPGLDQIFKYGRGSKMYKIISSAATNYDRHLVMTEVYGASGKIPVDILYREAIDQTAKGVNMFVPHAVWYDPATMPASMPPELSYRDSLYGPILPEYNDFIGRIHLLMQKPARHVADIAILYPIESLQATYHFGGPISAYQGGVPGLDDNYQELGESLMFEQHRDFTFLHPETLRDRCKIAFKDVTTRPVLRLTNTNQPAEFSILVIPTMQAISCETLKIIRDFWHVGGVVVATGTLPTESVEPGKEQEVEHLLREIFGDAIYERATQKLDLPIAVTASTEWSTGEYPPHNALDLLNRDSRWNSAAGSGNGQWLEISLEEPTLMASVFIVDTFHRVREFRISTRNPETGEWTERFRGEKIENGDLCKFPQHKANGVRIDFDRIEGDCVSISTVGLSDDQGKSPVYAIPACEMMRVNDNGGRAKFFRERIATVGLRLTQTQIPNMGNIVNADVVFLGDKEKVLPVSSATGSLMYRHHRLDGREVYFFGNSTDETIDVPMSLRGEFETLSWWNPHTGEITPMKNFTVREGRTEVRLKMPAVSAAFLVGQCVKTTPTER